MKKTMENLRKQAWKNWSKNELFGIRIKLSYNKLFSKNLLAIGMRRTRIHMNKPVYLSKSLLEMSKIVMYEFWMTMWKQNKEKKRNYVKWIQTPLSSTEDIFVGIAKDVKTRFDTSNYKLDRPLPKRKSKRVIGLIKYELGGEIRKKLAALRLKTCSYLINDENK